VATDRTPTDPADTAARIPAAVGSWLASTVAMGDAGIARDEVAERRLDRGLGAEVARHRSLHVVAEFAPFSAEATHDKWCQHLFDASGCTRDRFPRHLPDLRGLTSPAAPTSGVDLDEKTLDRSSTAERRHKR
jgi:hypothetical protein